MEQYRSQRGSLCALQIGVYNEKVLQRLDLIVAEAGNNGVRVMFPFVNFRDDMGGMRWYVDQVSHTAFPTSPHTVMACWQYPALLCETPY